ncbi:potassium channel subfamily T member 1 [Caerostris darwini]|uniref:Potassium channel subfamily T member 1 n=1 Tax=Caerostris darwini TaxID=1538125 RepID=A0AAV4MNK4_9ARAC|nr:potassium channel subfamily T member 1 [Caerostris darwini]
MIITYNYSAQVRVEFYVNENNVKERLQVYFFKNQSSSLRIRIITLVIKLLLCLLYVIRVFLDRGPDHAACYGCEPVNVSMFREIIPEQDINYNDMRPRSDYIHWNAVIWVDRPLTLWIFQTLLSILSLSEALLLVYLGYKGNIWHHLFSFNFILELVNNVPFIATFTFILRFRTDFPHQFQGINDSRSLFVCGFQHFQRAGVEHVNLFASLYFVVVTFSTVGYGDYKPDNWPSQLFMVVMICVALIVLPTQFEQLAYTWMERQKLGFAYSRHRAQNERHVVVCSTTLRSDTVMDFLNEFYAHPLLQDYYVVLLSPCELDATMKMILQIPMWAQRVIYIQGSALKDLDLARARMNAAEACFILAARNYADRSAADEHTILRSWAVRDFAPSVPQYVQIFRPENKVHVAFAGEFASYGFLTLSSTS